MKYIFGASPLKEIPSSDVMEHKADTTRRRMNFHYRLTSGTSGTLIGTHIVIFDMQQDRLRSRDVAQHLQGCVRNPRARAKDVLDTTLVEERVVLRRDDSAADDNNVRSAHVGWAARYRE
jgi:hypothetical protein